MSSSYINNLRRKVLYPDFVLETVQPETEELKSQTKQTTTAGENDPSI